MKTMCVGFKLYVGFNYRRIATNREVEELYIIFKIRKGMFLSRFFSKNIVWEGQLGFETRRKNHHVGRDFAKNIKYKSLKQFCFRNDLNAGFFLNPSE